MFGNSATQFSVEPAGSPFAPRNAGPDDPDALSPVAPDEWSTQNAEPPRYAVPLRVTRSGLFIFARVGRAFREVGKTLCWLFYCGAFALVIGLFTGGGGAVLAIPFAAFFVVWCAVELFFTLVCHVEKSEQAIRGHGRVQSKTVRESTQNGEIAYAKLTTTFQTVESGDFEFETEGCRELRPGDVVRLRLFRWTASGRIRDYDVLGFAVNY